MLTIETDTDGALITITPSGKLTEADIENLTNAMNETINTHDKVPALLIKAKSFPGWDSFATMFKHLKLASNREKLVPRIALVSDGTLLSTAPHLVNVFIKAEVRHFEEKHLSQAEAWARTGEPGPLAIEILDHYPNDVIAVKVSGYLTSRDYEEVLAPLVEEKLKRHDKLKMLLVVDATFEGASAGAMWDDAKLGLKHFTKYRKMAIVSDVEWMRNSVRLLGILMPGVVHVYPSAQREIADEWIIS